MTAKVFRFSREADDAAPAPPEAAEPAGTSAPLPSSLSSPPLKKRLVRWDDENVVPRRRRGTGKVPLTLLDEREGTLLSLVDGETPLPEVMDFPYLNNEEKREVMRSLAQKRLVEFIRREDIVRERRELHALEKWLDEETAALGAGMDFFSFLGVFPGASPAHLRHAYYRKAHSLDPARFEKFRSLKTSAAALQQRAFDAYETLLDPAARRAHTSAFAAHARGVKDALPREAAERAFREALYWWERGHVSECVMLIETARASFPEDAKYLLYAARAMEANPDLAAYAEKYYLRAADARPADAEPRLGLARLALRAGDRVRTGEWLRAAAALDAAHPDVLRLEGAVGQGK